ncbi:MAG: phage tail family protein [Syntrophomonas sp.]|nr:phage tail family protein [Syntrophomonas sp.]
MKSFTFNSISSDFFGLKVQSKNRPVLPDANDIYMQNCGYQGNFLFHAGLQDRLIDITCVLKSNSIQDMYSLCHQIAAWLFTTDKQILSFDDEPGRYYVGKVLGAIDFDSFVRFGSFTVRFRCDPLQIGTEQAADFVNDVLTVNNPGTFKTFPLFNLVFTAQADEITVAKGDEYVRLVTGFQGGDTYYINCATGAIYINTVRALDKLDWQNSVFFALEPGLNELSIIHTGKCTARLTYSPRYL